MNNPNLCRPSDPEVKHHCPHDPCRNPSLPPLVVTGGTSEHAVRRSQSAVVYRPLSYRLHRRSVPLRHYNARAPTRLPQEPNERRDVVPTREYNRHFVVCPLACVYTT